MKTSLPPVVERTGKNHGPGFYHIDRLAEKPIFATVQQSDEGPSWGKIRQYLREWISSETRNHGLSLRTGKSEKEVEKLVMKLPYKAGKIIDSVKDYVDTKKNRKQTILLEVNINALHHPDIYPLLVELEEEESTPIMALRTHVCISLDEKIPCLNGIPHSIGNMRNLVKLDIACCFLETLPDELGELANLEELHAHNNCFTQDPPCISRLISLETLELYNNRISTLSGEFGNLPNLEYLDLDSNQIEEIPRSLGKLLKLNNLHLRENPIKQFNDSLSSSQSIVKVNLNGCPIETLPLHLLSIPTIEKVIMDIRPFKDILDSNEQAKAVFKRV